MKKTIIMQHKIHGLYNTVLLLSTVKIGDTYETALLDDEDDLEMYRTKDKDTAIETHRRIMNECVEKAKATYPGISNYWGENQIIKNYKFNQWGIEA